MSVLERLVNGINEEKLGAYGVDVLIGDDAVQHRWRSDDRENIYSVSKGLCALAVGMAIDEGLLSLESTVPELLPAMELGAGVETVTIRHLCRAGSTSHGSATNPLGWRMGGPDAQLVGRNRR